ncbi:thioredoxin family protein [Ectothiorhodospiraceae bacterium BW-2]|nr:thioredoxin family protein [Ectothiorhodospiraceae bacterium BW-2]
MARTPSTMLALGTIAPAFTLLEPKSGRAVSLSDYVGKPILIAFICNHCPFVKLIGAKMAEVTAQMATQGVATVAINSNDVANYPDDSPEKMVECVAEYGFEFPYLYDESQAVAKAYCAACTPDFFLFDTEHKLFYRGQFDSARPGNGVEVSGEDMLKAVEALLKGGEVAEQRPSLGCNIKWKPGEAPDYFTILK